MSKFEPGTQGFTSGGEANQAIVSAAISAKRSADTLERIENALIILVEQGEKRAAWWKFWRAR